MKSTILRLKPLSLLVVCAALLVGPFVTSAAAQPPASPGQPRIVAHADCTITLSWNRAAGAAGYSILVVSYNGVNQNLVLAVGDRTEIRERLPMAGDWTFIVRAENMFGGTNSLPVSHFYTCGGAPPTPGGPPIDAPAWTTLNVAGSTVTGSFTPVSGATHYELEATIQASGQVLIVPLGPNVSFSVPGVPAGNFLARVRGRNAIGAGPWSASRLIVVGVVLLSGDLQVTLAWNSTADMDLHVIEPSGRHVSWVSRNGVTAFLDRDDTNGYGPENIHVPVGRGAPGVYQFYIVHYSGALNTSSSIAVTLFPGTARQTTTLFTRLTPSGNARTGYNVADIDIVNGTITETAGTRATDEGEAQAVKAPGESH